MEVITQLVERALVDHAYPMCIPPLYHAQSCQRGEVSPAQAGHKWHCRDYSHPPMSNFQAWGAFLMSIMGIHRRLEKLAALWSRDCIRQSRIRPQHKPLWMRKGSIKVKTSPRVRENGQLQYVNVPSTDMGYNRGQNTYQIVSIWQYISICFTTWK